ncbi:MAG: hypothetical protein KBS46_04535 [Clostridiales bacterium]|nr:hypothetical protein [Candidatus Apopatocola equi]MCQ2439805.1 hypothetical protein [Oscillospiraceae bacterium]
MVKLIMGLSGSGKTKNLVKLVHEALETATGSVVCIEKGKNLTYDIPYQVRLVHTQESGICTNEMLAGFLLGLHAGNYDISRIFIDDFNKILNDNSDEAVVKFLDSLNAYAEREGIEFTIFSTGDPDAACEGIRKYF